MRGRFGHESDRREVGDGVVGRLLAQALAVGVRAGIAHQEQVAVGIGLGDALRADGAGGGARLSTTMVCPSSSPMRCAWMRPRASMPPPGANGMTMVIGRVGQSCAATVPVRAMRAGAAAIVSLCITFSVFCRNSRLCGGRDQGHWGRRRRGSSQRNFVRGY